MKFWFATALTLTLSPWAAEAQSEIPTAIDAFVQSHCAECHRGGEPEGGLDFSKLGFDLANEETARRWVLVHDRMRCRRDASAGGTEPDADHRRRF